jgi:hypothetical protein
MLASCFRLVVAVALMVLAFEGSARAGGGPLPGVPEVDAGTMTTALALLSGAALVITNRFRRSK